MEFTDIIDPPVGSFSSPRTIESWIDELENIHKTDQVKAAIVQAGEWPASAKEQQEKND